MFGLARIASILAVFAISQLACAQSGQDRIPQLIDQLAHREFAERQSAQAELLKVSSAALPELRAALLDDRLEVRWRVRAIIKKISTVRLMVFSDRRRFEKHVRQALVLVDFDDVDTSKKDFVQFEADRYKKTKGIVIQGTDGQFAGRSYGFPAQFRPTSGPNSYAAGPTADVRAGAREGGHNTDVTFFSFGKPANVSAFGTSVIDADYPSIGPTRIAAYGADGTQLGIVGPITTVNGGNTFRGIVAIDHLGRTIPAISRIHVVTGCSWVQVDAGEGATLDDIVFPQPRVQDAGD